MEAPPDPHSAEHVAEHVARYKAIGYLLLFFTGVTVALSYFNFGSMKVNIAVAMLVATLKGTLVALNFMHLSAEKRLIYRILIFTAFFVLGLFWLTYLAWYNPIIR
ncbi:MAG: cytochrome-c oxidase [Chthoniobacterales bacterium]|nr:MAG: cytochrome-c oxidase [Chthoniobacterales bacterium]